MTIDGLTPYEIIGKQPRKVDVSIWCPTYNHVKYIRKCFEGIKRQNKNFDVEVFVFDDASTDGTTDVIREYCQNHSDVFRALIAKKNFFKSPLRMKTINEIIAHFLNGKYICYCEGDDYWIYDKKLQRQYDFMEYHPEVSLCMHNAINYNEETGEVMPLIMDMDSGYLDSEEIICFKHGHPPTASYFYRKESMKDRPDFFDECPVGDEPTRFWLAHKGRVYYMDKVWAVRNYMHEGSWNYSIVNNSIFSENHNKRWFKFLKNYNKYANYIYSPSIKERIVNKCKIILGTEMTDLASISYFDFNKIYKTLEYRYENEVDEYLEAFRLSYIKKYSNLEKGCLEYIKNSEKKLYIYGAGIEAKNFALELIENDINWEGFLVSQKQNIDSFMDHEIIQYDMLNESKDNVIIYAAMNSYNRLQVVPMLRKDGFLHII